MRATLRSFSYFSLLLLFPFTVFSQTYSIQPGTKSRRVDANGNLTWTFHDMTSWNSSPYQEFHLDDARANTIDMNFRLLPPVGYNPDLNPGDPGYREYPMIVFFHGAGEAAISWTGKFNYATTDPRYLNNDHNLYHGGNNLLNAVRRNESDSRAFPGFVLVPQARTSWVPADVDQALIIIDKLLEIHSIDRNRVYVHGLSAGGVATWRALDKRPDLFAAMVAFSAVPPYGYPYSKMITIPNWAFQGGLDESPTPGQARSNQTSLRNAGATPRFTEYPNLGHGTWNPGWNEPDFFSWFLSKSKTDIHAKFGKKDFCSDEPINGTLMLTAGFEAYEWRKDGLVIPDSTRNELTVTAVGSYTARFKRNGTWTDWSKPLEVKVIASPPAPIVVANGSTALVSLDGRTNVTLTAPDSMNAYRWSTNATTRSITVSNAGSYTVVITAPNGCRSAASVPVIVTRGNAAGTPTPPSGVAVTTVSETKLKIEWTDNSANETGFEIFRSLNAAAGYQFLTLVSPNTQQFTDSGLEANTTYFYRLRAINNSGGSAYTAAVSGTTSVDLIPPSAPANLRSTATSMNSVLLAWDPATDNVGVTEYLIFRDGEQIGTSTTTGFAVEGLAHEQSYVFTVKAKDKSENISIASNQVAKQAIAKGLYYELFLGGTWDSTVQLDTWGVSKSGYISNFIIATEPTGVRSEVDVDYFGFKFEGYIYITTAGTYTFYTRSDDGSRLWINDQQIVDNDGLHGSQERSGTVTLGVGAHKIKVVYFERTGSGETLTVSYAGPGVAKTAIPDAVLTSSPIAAPIPPVAPSNLAVSSTSSNSISLTWNDNSNNETGFEIYRGESQNGEFSIVSTTAANVTTIVDGSLNSSTTYFYKMRAVGATGESTFSNTVSGATQQAAGAPATPSNMVATATSKSVIALAWNDNSNNETGFEVYKAATENGQYQLITTTGAGVVSYNDINLLPATSYFYKVKAIIGNVASEFSNAATATTLPDIPAVPSSLVVSNITQNSVSMTWIDNSETETGFRIFRSATENGDYILIETTAANVSSFIDQPLAAGITYFYKLKSFNVSGESLEFSNVISATTLPEAPVAPVLLTANAVSTTEIQLTWQDNSTTETKFVIYRSDGGAPVKIDSVLSNVTAYSNVGLAGNKQFSYQIKAVNAGGESEFSNSLSATTLNNAPVIAAITNVAIQEEAATDVAISASDADGDAITISATGLPAFATFTNNGNGTGNISLAPGSGTAGTYQITVTATDNVTSSNVQFNVVVSAAPVNNAPVITAINNVAIQEGETSNVAISASDVEGDAILLSATGLPSFATFTDNGNGTGSISLAPGSGTEGTYQITVVATDNITSSNLQFNVEVSAAPINNAPEIAEVSDVVIQEGESVEVTLSATDADDDAVTISATGLPSFATFTGGTNGSAVITLNPDYSHAGVYSDVEIRAQDSKGSVTTTTFLITVEDNDPISGDPVVIYRINCGFNAVSDTPLNWEADSQTSPSPYADPTVGYPGGGTWWDTRKYKNETGIPSVIYASRRHGVVPGGPVRFDFPVVSGEYQVNLYFAEYSSWFAPKRRFNILLEGNIVQSSFSIYEEGGYDALKKTFVVNVSDGNLDFDLTHVSNEPIVSAIEIISLSGNASARLGGDPLLANMILGIGDEMEAESIKAFPNPFQDNVTISFVEPVSGPVSITLVDVLGKIHYLENKSLMHQSEIQLSLNGSKLLKGVYLLKLNHDNREQVIRLVK